MTLCSSCGTELTAGVRFCRVCGTPTDQAAPPTVPPLPPPPLVPGADQPRPADPAPAWPATGPQQPVADPTGGYWAAVGRQADLPSGAGPRPPDPARTPPAGIPVLPAAAPPASRSVLFAVIAVLALVVAAVVGYLVVSGGSDGSGGPGPTTTPTGSGSTAPGATSALTLPVPAASCQGAPSRDTTGRATTYTPDLVADGRADTAWRCDDDGVGQHLTFTFATKVHLTSVGLIPGLVKKDPGDGTDRFVQNNKVAGVRWSFDDGATVDQLFDPVGTMQRRAVDVTTRTVTLTIASVTPGQRAANDKGQLADPTGKTPIAEVELQGSGA